MKALIDGDIVTFRAAFSAEDEEEVWIPCARADKILEDMLHEIEATSYEVWLSGENNFRYDVFPEYKANRINQKRPKWEHHVKSHLVANWAAEWSDRCEADDLMGSRQSDNTVICTIDKDLNQIPGWHYNFVRKERYYVTEDEGFRFFCYQLMVGDPTDGIKGIPGIGPKKANRFLDSTPSEQWLEGIRTLYGSWEEMDMNAKCVFIWRKLEDDWKERFGYKKEEDTERVDPSP